MAAVVMGKSRHCMYRLYICDTEIKWPHRGIFCGRQYNSVLSRTPQAREHDTVHFRRRRCNTMPSEFISGRGFSSHSRTEYHIRVSTTPVNTCKKKKGKNALQSNPGSGAYAPKITLTSTKKNRTIRNIMEKKFAEKTRLSFSMDLCWISVETWRLCLRSW